MDQLTREVLEFDAVLALVAGRASSPLGRDFVLSLEPLPTMSEIERRHGILRDLITLFEKDQPLPLGGLFDARERLQEARIEGSVLEEEAWPRILTFLDICRRVVDFRERHREKAANLATLLAPMVSFPDFQRRLELTLDKDGRIRDDASPELRAAKNALRSSEQRLMRLVNTMVTDLDERGLLQEKFSTMRNGRHVFPVRSGARGRVSGILHGSSGSGETMYIEPPEVVEATNETEIHREAVRREIFRILEALTIELRACIPFCLENLEVLREADGLAAIARTAVQKGWALCIIGPKAPLRLFNTHHPLLNLREGPSVPITILLDAGDRCVILSGPNAGGKTTAMKMLGLVATLARCGCPLPAFPDSSIPFYDNVFADIGDQQDLSAGLSTFSGHIRRIRDLWRKSAGRSLVLLDELGTGTDPQEGGALALALLESFLERAALTVTTSHLNPVKVWAEDTAGVRNASFSLDPATHEPTFRLRIDVPGASEALEIAEREGLDRQVLDRARALVGERHLQMGELLRRIEEREQRLAAAVKQAEARAAALEQQESVARARAEMLRDERREMREDTLRDREKTLSHDRERIERLIATLPSEEDLARRREALVRAREEILRDQQMTASERRRLAEQHVETGAFTVGQRVYTKTFGQWGEIVRLEGDGEKARVLIGQIEASLRTEDLLDHDPEERRAEQRARSEEAELAALPPGRRQKKSRKIRNVLRRAEEYSGPTAAPRVTLGGSTVRTLTRPDSMTLDLHGYRVEEAIAAMDVFLDRSLLANFPYVKILHGTGSGRLYRAVHEYLREQPMIRSYRFGTPDEGGAGITIVEF